MEIGMGIGMGIGRKGQSKEKGGRRKEALGIQQII
jgi:hypothetical protein